MRSLDLVISAAIASVVHLGLLCVGNLSSESVLMFDPGESCITLRLLPSVESRPSASRARVHSATEKKLPPVEEPELKRIRRRETEVIEFKHPEVVTDDELTLKVKEASPKEPLLEPPELGPEVNNALVVVEDVDKTLPQAPAEQPEKSSTQEESESSVDSPPSKAVEADLREKGVTTPARRIGVLKPEYPSSCRRKGCQGTALFEFSILPDGSSSEIVLIQSAGCPKLDEAAEEALRKGRFVPAKRFGIAVSSRKKIAFRFELKPE